MAKSVAWQPPVPTPLLSDASITSLRGTLRQATARKWFHQAAICDWDKHGHRQQCCRLWLVGSASAGGLFVGAKRQQPRKRHTWCNAVGQGELPLVNVEDTGDGRGRCLCAIRDVEAGEILLTEAALFSTSEPEDEDQDCGANDQRVVDLFSKLTRATKDAILQLYCPAEPLPDSATREEGFNGEGLRFHRILRVNGINLPTGCGGVFPTGSRANHSCRPNALLRTSSDRLRIIAVRQVLAGEEVTVSYLSEDSLLQPTAERRRRLEAWGFHCGCERCASADDTRSLGCPTCAAGGSQGQVSPGDGGSWGPCRACGSSGTAALLERCETDWLMRHESLPFLECQVLYGVRNRRYAAGSAGRRETAPSGSGLEALTTLHTALLDGSGTVEGSPAPVPGAHWLAAVFSDLAAEAHLWRGEAVAAIAAARSRRAFIRSTLGEATLSREAAETLATEAEGAMLAGDEAAASCLYQEALDEALPLQLEDDSLVLHIRGQLGAIQE
mmetsp:Transcript_52811/g.153639  ORF Transcript_52811/g.153639 Transcript_52811/m.153639 type:complete len:500 (+) Transcript_52811:80-1579(+)